MRHGESYCRQNQEQLTLAEDLCADCSNNTATKVHPTKTWGKIDKAWRLFEFAIATANYSAKERGLQLAQRFVEVASRERSSFSTQNRALILKGLMPALVDRAWRRPIRPQSRHASNQSYGEVLVDRYGRGITNNGGLAPEALVLYLLSRIGDEENDDFYFAGSPREEASGLRKRDNHDMYKILPAEASTKFPVQLKAGHWGRGYDVPVLNITMALRPVLSIIGEESLNTIMNIAASERLGHETSREKIILDFAAHCLRSTLKAMEYKMLLKNR